MELILKQFILDNLRYIINNCYNETNYLFISEIIKYELSIIF